MTSTGGKFVWNDDQETPNTQQATFDFGDAQMTFEVRNLPTPPEGGVPVRGPNYVGISSLVLAAFLMWITPGLKCIRARRGTSAGKRLGVRERALARSTRT